ncbi:MAG: sulfatase [Planctomycetota bacterium]
MKFGVSVLVVVSATAAVGCVGVAGAQEAARLNVLLIVCDDLNDWVGPLGGHRQAQTPAIDAFAESAVVFENASCSTPVCAPSRASFLTGIEPYTSGNLFWSPWFENEVLANSKTMMRHFRDNGYIAVGAGKLMHHEKPDEWDERPHRADYGPLVIEDGETAAHPGVPEPFASIGAIDGSFGPIDDRCEWVLGRQRWVGGVGSRVPYRVGQPTPDERVAAWAAGRIERFAADDDDRPFFMGVGFIRPHTPMHAPPEFFDPFPIGTVELPAALLPDDEADTHYATHFGPEVKGLRYYRQIAESYESAAAGLREFARAYLASVAFVDAQIGTVLDALDRTGLAENTIVILTSDHGFQMGEKGFLFKNSLWEESNRVPLMIRAPGVGVGVGVGAGRCGAPVSLIDLYPTLVDLCGLNGDTRITALGRSLDGSTLRPLLADPDAGEWHGPDASLTMVHAEEEGIRPLTAAQYDDPRHQHWSLRTERFRYIRYNTGLEELYDHAADPHEWWNIAGEPSSRSQIDRFRAMLSDRIGLDLP